MVKIISIPRQDIWSMTDAIGPFIRKGLEYAHGEMDEQSIYEKVSQGLMEAWVVLEGATDPYAVLATELIIHPCNRVVRVVLCGGEHLDKWMDAFLSVMDDYARRWNADGIEVIGRKGWERILKDKGYRYAYTGLLKEVSEPLVLIKIALAR